MTDDEEFLYFIAKNIIMMNPEFNILITGSLMLALRGINKRRKAHDIDFLLCWNNDFPDIILPESFEELINEESYDDTSLKQFYSEEYNITIDFICSDLSYMISDGIFYGMQCASLQDLINAKISYSKNKENTNYIKHMLDIIYMQENNKLDESYFTNFEQ